MGNKASASMDVSVSASASGGVDASADGQPAAKKRRLSFKGLRNSFRRSGRGRRSNKGVKGLKYKQGSPRVEADVSGPDLSGDVEMKPKGGEYGWMDVMDDPPPFAIMASATNLSTARIYYYKNLPIIIIRILCL